MDQNQLNTVRELVREARTELEAAVVRYNQARFRLTTLETLLNEMEYPSATKPELSPVGRKLFPALAAIEDELRQQGHDQLKSYSARLPVGSQVVAAMEAEEAREAQQKTACQCKDSHMGRPCDPSKSS